MFCSEHYNMVKEEDRSNIDRRQQTKFSKLFNERISDHIASLLKCILTTSYIISVFSSLKCRFKSYVQ